MYDKFYFYYPLNEDKLKKIWETCTFIVDTNILLNLYRYSDNTRNTFLKILKKYKERLWLPHRVGEEFFANRVEVISKQEETYNDAIKEITSLEELFDNERNHPFLSDKTRKDANEIFDDIKKELKNNKKTHKERINRDPILKEITCLFNNKVGEEYETTILEEIFKTGKKRYEQQIPPGYKDKDKGKNCSLELQQNKMKYGDLIIWNQILDYAKKEEKDVIFITDENKEDWWKFFSGQKFAPRPELIEEFCSTTKRFFHMYRPDRFIEFASKDLKDDAYNKTINEIRKMEKIRNKQTHDLDLNIEGNEALRYNIEIQNDTPFNKNYINHHIHKLQRKKAQLYSELKEFNNILGGGIKNIEQEELNMIFSKIDKIENTLSNIDKELSMFQNILNTLELDN